MSAFTPPPGYRRIKVVKTFCELVSTSFGDGVNALCWARDLPGDFSEVVAQLGVSEGITTIDDARLEALRRRLKTPAAPPASNPLATRRRVVPWVNVVTMA